MNEYDSLYRTVCANPDDDVPRLVLADWLQEHGDEDRAEFIGVQCRLAKTLPEDPHYRDDREREQTLLEAGHRAWTPKIMPGRGWAFRRGFIERLDIWAVDFLTRCAELFDVIPLREVRLELLRNFGQRIAELRPLSQLTGLVLSDQGINLPGLQPFCISEHLGNLRRLDLSSNPIGDSGVRQLAQCPTFANLRELILADEGRLGYSASIHAAGAAAIANSPHLTNLERLDFRGQVIGDGGLRAIAESGNARSLRVLDVSSNDIGAIGTAGIEALAASDKLRSLIVLDLSDNDIGDAGARELAEWPGLSRLILLRLRHCRITDSGAKALLKSPFRPDRLVIEWHGNPLSDGFSFRLN